MVRALLAGTKTQTRRIMNPQPTRSLPHTGTMRLPGHDPIDIHHPLGWRWKTSFWSDGAGGVEKNAPYHSPYGQAGERLWVRETWRTFERPEDGRDGVLFFADGAFVEIPDTREASDLWLDDHANGKHGDNWRPSIYMRRWASRITLEVTEVRVQRLQDISEEDARAEGVSMVPFYPDDGLPLSQGFMVGADDGKTPLETSAAKAFAKLWDEINGKRAPWASNPWLWCVSFRRLP